MVTARALIPKLGKLLSREDANAAINAALDESAGGATRRVKVKVSLWKHQPKWTTSDPESFVREVTTDDDIFRFQDEGTDGPYPIKAKNKQYLHFRGKRGWRRAKEVTHPGLKAQEFSKQVAATLQQNDMPRIFQRHFARKLS